MLASAVAAALLMSAAQANAQTKGSATKAEVQSIQAQMQALTERLNRLEAANAELKAENGELQALADRREAEMDYLKAQTKELREEGAMASNEIAKVKGAELRAVVNVVDRGNVYYVAKKGLSPAPGQSLADFFKRLERLTGVPAPRLRLPSQVNVLGSKLLERVAKWRGVEPKLDPQEVEIGEHYFYLDPSKAERELGFRARDPYETLHDTVQYLGSRMPPGFLPGTKGRLAQLRKEG